MIDISAIPDWLKVHGTLLWILSAVSLAIFVGTLALIPYLIVRIPEDYFIREHRICEESLVKKSVVHILYLIVKNLTGIVLVIVGFVMFFIPGQGVLTMLIGIMLMNFPGKRTLAVAIVRQPTVCKSINWTRAKALRPPLILPPK